MKNKIVCLFNKIKADHLVCVIGFAMIFLLVFAMVVAPLTASAASYFPYTFSILNTNNVPIESINLSLVSGGVWHSENQLGTYTAERSIGTDIKTLLVTVNDEGINVDGFGLLDLDGLAHSIPNGTYEIAFYVGIDANALTIALPTEYAGDEFPSALGVLQDTACVIILDDGTISHDFVLIQETDLESPNTLTMVLVPTDSTDTETPTCPSLEQQIADYNGSWVQFINMVRQNNAALGNAYQSVVDEAIVAGKISVQGNFINFDGTYDELLALLMTTSNNNPNIQAVLEQELQRQFENGAIGGYDDGYSDGKDYGQEVGYNEGYQEGYNKCASDELVQGFFGNMLLGVTKAIDGIHIYEEYNEAGELTFYISPWSILITISMVSIVIILLKVWRGG